MKRKMMKRSLALAGIAAILATGSVPLAASAAETPRTVQLKVTSKGFEPKNVTVKKGEPVELVVERQTDKTCAKHLVLPAHDIKKELPLNQAVKVTFTPEKTGTLKYGCAMGQMMGGTITVE